MIHLDLFSGIGGFALAVEEVFGDVEHIFCEIDPYCQTLLKRRFPGATIFGDIRGLTADTYWNRLQEQGSEQQASGDRQLLEIVANSEGGKSWVKETRNGREDFSGGDSELFILTGGFPCQPFSQAGKRRGAEDNRYLWPEMLRVIREFKPTWVIAENVGGILTIEQGMVFEQVCLNLESEGYEVQPFIIPAVAKNAPHRRDRVWFVAHKPSKRLERSDSEKRSSRCSESNQVAQNPVGKRSRRRNENRRQVLESQSSEIENARPSWERNWVEVATELCRVDDGLPAELDGLKLSKSRHRVERLKALGNAIVPQVAVEIMRGIKKEEI